MPPKIKTILSWSSGKGSAYSLFTILKENRFEIVELLTTVTDTFNRVSMHGVREELLEAQAASLSLPLHKIRIPSPCPNEIYEAKMAEYLKARQAEGIRHVIFGDLFLTDLPAGVDPCGENGEFHSFVHDGPIFNKKIPIRVGKTVEREGYAFADVLPA